MKRNYFLTLIMILLAFFTLCLGACGNKNNTPTPTPNNNKKNQLTEEEIAEINATLNAIPVEDYHVIYDGKEHHIREAQFAYPKAGNVSYGSYDKYTLPGTYQYHVTFGLKGIYRECDVNLVIEKYKPVYTGEEALWVFLDEGSSFETPFDVDGVELMDPINLTTTGDYTITIQTKENDKYLSSEPVNLQLYVRQTHYVFGFEDKTVKYDGTAKSLSLDTSKTPLDETLFSVAYLNNTNNVEFGKYYVTAVVTEKTNNVVYDTYRAILTIDRDRNAAFDEYVQEAFEYLFGDDQLTINILIGDYTQYGLEHKEAKWYTYEPYSDEDYQHDVNEVKSLRDEFKTYDKNTLSYSQLIDYELIDEMIKEYELLFVDKSYIDMQLNYVDQYGGYCAELPSEIEGFHINSKEDLDDMVDLLNSVYPAFMSYYDSIVDRENAGYPLNEYTLTKFVEYLDGVIEAYTEGEYYLIKSVNNSFQLNENMGLTQAQRLQYANTIKGIFNGDYLKAHKDLRDKVNAYIESKKAEGGYLANTNFDIRYLGQYENGKEVYKALLERKLGCFDLDMDEYYNQLLTWFKKYYNMWSETASNLTSKAEEIADGKVQIASKNNFQTLLAYLKEFAKTLVPDLEATPKIDVIEMDDTVTANTETAAYYMKSPLSESANEYIHINPKAMGSGSDVDYLKTLSTLAHEGYPGHLYAYVNCKENDNLSPFAVLKTNTTHGEGWATYVQVELNYYILSTKVGEADYEDWKVALEYANAYDFMSYLLYSICDYEVNYNQKDVKGLKNAISHLNLSFGKDEVYEELFHTFNESPAQYPAYGFGKAYFWQIHEEAKEALGANYNVVEFNQMLLEHGWCSIDRLQKYYDDYMADTKFKSGLGK